MLLYYTNYDMVACFMIYAQLRDTEKRLTKSDTNHLHDLKILNQ